METDYGSNGHFSMYSLMKICIDLCCNLFLFNILKYHIEKRMSSKIAKFADDTQISKTLRARTNCDEIFFDLKGLNDSTTHWWMKFSVDECKVMHMGKNNLSFTQSYEL